MNLFAFVIKTSIYWLHLRQKLKRKFNSKAFLFTTVFCEISQKLKLCKTRNSLQTSFFSKTFTFDKITFDIRESISLPFQVCYWTNKMKSTSSLSPMTAAKSRQTSSSKQHVLLWLLLLSVAGVQSLMWTRSSQVFWLLRKPLLNKFAIKAQFQWQIRTRKQQTLEKPECLSWKTFGERQTVEDRQKFRRIYNRKIIEKLRCNIRFHMSYDSLKWILRPLSMVNITNTTQNVWIMLRMNA